MTVTYDYLGTVYNVVDGDTVDLSVDLGFRQYMRDRFRLTGINTPERGQPGWAEATAALRAFLPLGQSVLIQTLKPRDKYGRWLATVSIDGLNINEAMIEAGHAARLSGATGTRR